MKKCLQDIKANENLVIIDMVALLQTHLSRTNFTPCQIPPLSNTSLYIDITSEPIVQFKIYFQCQILLKGGTLLQSY